jgi:ASCH domain
MRSTKSRETKNLSIKALTIRQPWAELILRGRKPFELRSWRTKYRGPLVIHAAAKVDAEDAHSTLKSVTHGCFSPDMITHQTIGRRAILLPTLSAGQVDWVVQQVVAYIGHQRQTYRPGAAPLTLSQKTAMRPFFPNSALDSTRLVILSGQRVDNPTFYGEPFAHRVLFHLVQYEKGVRGRNAPQTAPFPARGTRTIERTVGDEGGRQVRSVLCRPPTTIRRHPSGRAAI